MTDPLGEVLAAYENDPDVVFVLDRNLRIIYCNAAWDRFAVENRGITLLRPAPYGRSLIDVVPDRLRSLYATAFRSVWLSRAPWHHHYECSSADTYRFLRMTVRPDSHRDLLIVVNTLIEERPHDADRQPKVPSSIYHEPGEVVTMCSNCRRTCRPGTMTWDWVPDYIRNPPELVAYGVCQCCSRSTGIF
jgi:hypothetical protein